MINSQEYHVPLYDVLLGYLEGQGLAHFSERREKRKKRKPKAETRRSDNAALCTYTLLKEEMCVQDTPG